MIFSWTKLEINQICDITTHHLLADRQNQFITCCKRYLRFHTCCQGNETAAAAVRDCSAQDAVFNLVFTLGVAAVGLSSYPFGALFDRCGLRVSRVVARCSRTSNRASPPPRFNTTHFKKVSFFVAWSPCWASCHGPSPMQVKHLI